MLIKVFDSIWFEPTGIHLEERTCNDEDSEKYGECNGTIISRFPEYYFYTPSWASQKVESAVICSLPQLPDEVGAEINRQIKANKE